MKKTALLLILALILMTTACSNSEPVVNSNAVDEVYAPSSEFNPEEVEVPEANEFYTMMQSDLRPVAVMIDNDVDASRPQIGLESAYMVYEIIIEGGKTRMMALFKEHDLEKVGPIRSSRHYFLDFALEHDAIYCHAGWSPKAQSDITALGVKNVNGLNGGDGVHFWRDNTYDSTWHNLYSGVNRLYGRAVDEKGFIGTTDVVHNIYLPNERDLENGQPATEINIPYSGSYRTSYTYDAENKVYNKYADGKEHMSQTGNIVTAKNIIIYQVENFNLNDGDNAARQDLADVGSGTGYYVTNGKVININWSKTDRKAKTIYTTEDGKELELNPGNTFVQIVPTSSTITIS